jgi:hypothetical protein
MKKRVSQQYHKSNIKQCNVLEDAESLIVFHRIRTH